MAEKLGIILNQKLYQNIVFLFKMKNDSGNPEIKYQNAIKNMVPKL